MISIRLKSNYYLLKLLSFSFFIVIINSSKRKIIKYLKEIIIYEGFIIIKRKIENRKKLIICKPFIIFYIIIKNKKYER